MTDINFQFCHFIRWYIVSDCRVIILIPVQDDGSFTVTKVSPNVSECISLITEQYVLVLSTYHSNIFVALPLYLSVFCFIKYTFVSAEM